MGIPATSRNLLEKVLPGQTPANQQQRSAFNQSAQMASTNAQNNATMDIDGMDLVEQGIMTVKKQMAEIDKRSKELDAARDKILKEEQLRQARTEIFKDLKPILQKRGMLLDEIQSEAFGTSQFKEGVTNPLQLGDLSLQQRGDFLRNASDISSAVKLREEGVGQVVAGMAKTREQDYELAQQQFENARLSLADAQDVLKTGLSLAEYTRMRSAAKAAATSTHDIGNGVRMKVPTFQEFIKAKEQELQMSIADPEQYRDEYAQKTVAQKIADVSNLSPEAQQLVDNPALLNNYTPTRRGELLGELAKAGVDASSFAIPNINATQRKEIALYDEIEGEAQFAQSMIDAGVNTGIFASPSQSALSKVGLASDKYINYTSAIANLNSILLRMRSGAAVTPQEFERIRDFIPGKYEDEKSATQKITRFFDEINTAKNNYINRATQTPQEIKASVKTNVPKPSLNQFVE